MNNISNYKLTKWRRDALLLDNDIAYANYPDEELFFVDIISKMNAQIIELTQELMDRNLISKKD